jgi:regulator of replication initiation timing
MDSPSIETQIDLASQQLITTYRQLNQIQEELLALIAQEEEHLANLQEEDLKKISFTLDKLPEYKAKLAEITKAMSSIEKRSQKLKRRAIYVEEQAKNGPKS